MPLWLVFHPTGTFEDTASKQALTKDITKIYTGIGLPAFYVVVNFMKVPPGDVWVGAERKMENPFIRIDQFLGGRRVCHRTPCEGIGPSALHS